MCSVGPALGASRRSASTRCSSTGGLVRPRPSLPPPKDILLLVPIEEGRHPFAPTRPEWTIETAPPTEAVFSEDPLEGLLVLRVGFPRHLEAKTHVPCCTRSRVNNISRGGTRAIER